MALIEMARGISHWYRPEGALTLREICSMHADWALGMVRAARNGKPVRVAAMNLSDPKDLYLEGQEKPLVLAVVPVLFELQVEQKAMPCFSRFWQ